ncbi:MAG TPA: dienelactone hydrolase family protein, partial [Mariprofundaceae bacterium]|nr:dienelactone hydrolase family protein [Mariprofundaceae bacterium]
IVYGAGDETCRGYLARPAGEGAAKRPGVLVLHEWWGHSDYVRDRAEKLAALGYTALAADMFGEGRTAETPEAAQGLMQQLMGDPVAVRRRFEAARDTLLEQPDVDGERLAVIGYCMGGGIALEMARAGEPLRGVVAFHGVLGTEHPAEAEKVRARVLALTGDDDAFAPESDQTAFEQEMQAAGVDYELVRYPGVKHAFTNPAVDEKARRFDLPLAYDAEADADSWRRMQVFLERVFA